MAETLSRSAKKTLAKEFYLSSKRPQKEIAKMIGVAENTISRWVRDGKWEMLKAGISANKENALQSWYEQIAEINRNIANREEGKRFPSPSEADSLAKTASNIKKLETDTGIGEIVSVCRNLCEFVRQYDAEKAKEISEHFNAFIEHKMK